MKKNENIKFPGFTPQLRNTFWLYPSIMDEYRYLLSGTEQKVLDFVLRRTLGWRKASDKISLSQFKYGIKNKKTGKWVDKGIGISNENSILKATKRLEEIGFFTMRKSGGKTTEYTLRLLTNGKSTTNQQLGVTSNQQTDTTNNTTKNIFQDASLKKKKKPFYNGYEMRYVEWEKRWYVLEKGRWLKYADKLSKIEWR